MTLASLPTGHQIRRWTCDRTRYHSDAWLSEFLSNVYTAFLAVAMAASMVFSLSSSLGQAASSPQLTPTHGSGLDGRWVVVLSAVAAVVALVGLATRFGPLALSAAQSTWWLPLATERRTLLRPTAYRWPTIGALLGAIAGIAMGLATGADPSTLTIMTAAMSSSAVAFVAVAGLAQSRARLHESVRVVADVLLAMVPIAGVFLAANGRPTPTFTVLVVGWAVTAAAVAVALVILWDIRLADIPAVSLRNQGAAADEALVAVLSLDPRGLGRALAARTEPPCRRRSTSMRWLGRIPAHRRPAAALIASDLLLFLRTPRYVVQVVLSACLPALALLARQPRAVAVVITLLVGAYLAALATADGARRAQVNTALDAMLPLGQWQVRGCRMVAPSTVMIVWSLAVAVLLAWRYGDPVGWLLLAVLAAPMWAAAAVRAAYRPLPDFTAPLIDTPLGAIPSGVSGIAARGPDIVFLGSVPLVVAVILGTVPPLLPPLQGLLTLGSVALASRPAPRSR